VQISYLVPIAILGILAGVFVDRWPLKRTLVSSDVIRGFSACFCSVSTQIWHFYAILAAISVVSSFFGPAQGVVIREAVPLHGLRSSNALMQQVMFMHAHRRPRRIAGLLVKPSAQPLLLAGRRQLLRLGHLHRVHGHQAQPKSTSTPPRRTKAPSPKSGTTCSRA
jgi:hypothetical protein